MNCIALFLGLEIETEGTREDRLAESLLGNRLEEMDELGMTEERIVNVGIEGLEDLMAKVPLDVKLWINDTLTSPQLMRYDASRCLEHVVFNGRILRRLAVKGSRRWR